LRQADIKAKKATLRAHKTRKVAFFFISFLLNYDFALRRREIAPSPSKPIPRIRIDAGSGTAAAVAVKVAE
jgi:hypothetical protein